MTNDEKLRALGIEPTGEQDGLPTLPDRFLKRVRGSLKVFFDRRYYPFEEPEEDSEFPLETLEKIQSVLDGKTGGLTSGDLETLSALEVKDRFSSELDAIPEAVWKEFLLEVMKERLKSKPAYLAPWIAKVEASGLSGALK